MDPSGSTGLDYFPTKGKGYSFLAIDELDGKTKFRIKRKRFCRSKRERILFNGEVVVKLHFRFAKRGTMLKRHKVNI